MARARRPPPPCCPPNPAPAIRSRLRPVRNAAPAIRSRLRPVRDRVLDLLAPAEGEEWLVLVIVLLLLLGGLRQRLEPWLRDLAAEPPSAAITAIPSAETERFGRVDLNRASAEELESLPAIGPRLAARILEDRERRGRFRTLADLDRVPGIGPHVLARIQDAVTVGPPPVPAPRQAE